MTGVSPERAAYEAGRWPDVIPWEEASPEVKSDYQAKSQAAIDASPELAEARERIADAERFCRALLAVQPPGAEHSGPVKTTARAVLAYLGAEPMASPETSAAAVTRMTGAES